MFVGLAGAAMLGKPAWAADKVVAGTLGGQAPLWPFYVASHKGFFAAEDLDVEINFAQSGAAVTQQLTGGSFDVALSVGITDPIHAIDKGAALAIIRIIGKNPPYVLIGKPELKSIADLKGKTVSIGQANDITTNYFQKMAEANGLKRGDYDALGAGTAAARYAALRAGVADAAFVLPPVNFQAATAGYVTLGIAADYVKNMPFTGMAVRRDWAQAHVSIVKRILSATDKSVAWLADQSHRGDAIELLVSIGRSSKADADASYDFLRHIDYFQTDSRLSRATLQNTIDIERGLGNIGPTLTVDRLVMPEISALTD